MAFCRMENRRMCDNVYRKLGVKPNIERAWGLLREIIGPTVFRSEFVPVPYIELAAFYNQLFVFTKKQSIWSTIGLRPPTYKVIGNMDYILNRCKSTWRPQLDVSPWNIADDQNFDRECGLRFLSDQNGVQKIIEFTALQIHARSAQPPVARAVTICKNLLQDLVRANTLYVITDVVFVSHVEMLVKIGNEAVNFVYDRDMPIGFRYIKYKFGSDGTFITEMPTSLKVHEDEAVWLEPIPAQIRWDDARRLYSGAVRRRKSNLSLPPFHERSHNNPQVEELENLQIFAENLVTFAENINAISRALFETEQVRQNNLNDRLPDIQQVAEDQD